MKLGFTVAVAALVAGGALAWDASTASASRTPARVVPPAPSVTPSARLRLPNAATSLRIDGQVALAGVASGPAVVTLRVGDAVSTVPVSLPEFSVQVPGVRAEAMVSIEIVSGHGKHAAILGSYARLARKAGADAILTTGELDRVRVTAMGTSLHRYVSRVLGDRLPASDDEHEQAIRSIGNDAAVGGAVLQALASGVAPLPAGYAHGYALLQDEAGLRRYLADHPDVAATYETFAQQPSGIALPLAALATETAILPALAHGEATMLPRAARLLLRRNGGFEYHGPSRTDPLATVTALDAGTLRMTPRVPAQSFGYPSVELVPGEGLVQVLARYESVGETWRRHFVGDRYSLWSVTEVTRVSYPDHPQLAATELVNTRIAHTFSLHDLSRRFWPHDVMDRRVLPYFCLAPHATGLMDVLWDCEYGQTTFIRDGNGLVQEIGSKVDANMQPRVGGFGTEFFRWDLGPRGALQLRFPGVVVKYWRLEGGDATAVPVVYLVRKQGADGRTHTLAGTSVLMDGPGGPGMNAATVLGAWSYGTFAQNLDANEWQTPPTETVFVRNQGGVAEQLTRFPGGEFPDSVAPSSWRLVDIEIYSQPYTRLYESRYRGNNSRLYASCADAYAGGATDCIPDRVRYFRPMAYVGERVYGIEDLYQNGAWFGEAPILNRYVRPTYHQRVASDVAALPPRQSGGKSPKRRSP